MHACMQIKFQPRLMLDEVASYAFGTIMIRAILTILALVLQPMPCKSMRES